MKPNQTKQNWAHRELIWDELSMLWNYSTQTQSQLKLKPTPTQIKSNPKLNNNLSLSIQKLIQAELCLTKLCQKKTYLVLTEP